MEFYLYNAAIQQGLLYSIAVLGIIVSFRVLNYPDLTLDGAFTLGGAIVAKLLVSGYSVGIALLLSSLGGFLAGCLTASIHKFLGINKILSGILMMLMLYSVNLRIMGKSNISLLRTDTIFTWVDQSHQELKTPLITLSIVVLLLLLGYLFTTRLGLTLRGVGDNEFMVSNQGVNTSAVTILGLGFSNALIALAGAIITQNQGYSDVSMGIGLIVTILASLIIGESILYFLLPVRRKILASLGWKNSPLPWRLYLSLLFGVIGSIVYTLIIAICLDIGLPPTDLRLASGIIVIAGISLQRKKVLLSTPYETKW
jgi:putative tryptophan/tyrosine transport system permease protein